MPKDICPFYLYESAGWLSSRETCKAVDREISSTTYNNYCEGNYQNCPNYKPPKAENGCYLTSACVEAMGMNDDCYALTVLRGFRDHWLANQAGGQAEIQEYYRVAPLIVEKIHAAPDSDLILKNLYANLVRPCVAHIAAGRYEAAHELYASTAVALKDKYLYSGINI